MLKNNKFKTVSNISEMLGAKGVRGENIPETLTIYGMVYFKYALITFVDVGKSFLQYKN